MAVNFRVTHLQWFTKYTSSPSLVVLQPSHYEPGKTKICQFQEVLLRNFTFCEILWFVESYESSVITALEAHHQ